MTRTVVPRFHKQSARKVKMSLNLILMGLMFRQKLEGSEFPHDEVMQALITYEGLLRHERTMKVA